VVEHRGGVQQHLEDQHGNRGRPQRGDYGELDHHRQQNLDRMEAQSGGHVEFEVGMMHAMQPPQRRHRMEEDMLEIDRKVEKNDRRKDSNRDRERNLIEQAPSMRLGNEGKANGRDRKHEADEQRVDHHHAEIAGPAHAAANRLFASWTDEFPDRHHGEHAAESAQTDKRLVGEHGVAHGLNALLLLDK